MLPGIKNFKIVFIKVFWFLFNIIRWKDIDSKVGILMI